MIEIVYQVNDIIGIWSGYLTNNHSKLGTNRFLPVPLMLYPGNLIFWSDRIDGTKIGTNYRWSTFSLSLKKIKQDGQWKPYVFQHGEWFRIEDAVNDGILTDVSKSWNREIKLKELLK